MCRSMGWPRFEWGSVTARPVDFEHGQIALLGGIFVHNGIDMQKHRFDDITTRKPLNDEFS